MFSKKVSLVLIILVFMLSLGVVSATDTNTTDDVVASDVDEEPPSGSINDLSTDEVVAALDSSKNGDYELRGNDVNMYYKGTANYEAVLSQNQKPVNGKSVIININGVVYNKTTDVNGKVSVPLNLNVGNYVVSASYGNLNLLNNVKVLPVISGKDVVKTYKSSQQYSATFLDSNGNLLKNTNVKFKINGKTYTKKTDSKGVASLDLDLKVGQYTVLAIHPNGYKISNKVVIKHSIVASNLNKHYKSSKKFTATFFGKNGKVLAKKKIRFKYRGHTYSVNTNKKGVASLKINSEPGTYKIVAINTHTGEKVTKSIKVSKTLYADKVSTFTGQSSKFKVKLYKNEKLVKDAKIKVYYNGVKKTVKTNKNGVGTVNFKLSVKGTYNFKSVDPYTGYTLNTKVKVKLASIEVRDIGAINNEASYFQAKLLKQNGDVAKNAKVKITINGISQIVKTNSKGIASVGFKLPVGHYKVECEDLSTGYKATCKITVVKNRMGLSYNKYGVSDDGNTILAMGRPSSSGEVSKYGYTWYMVEFERTCPHCHSHDLYWGIFWAGDETSNWGTFPVTGNNEGSSAEGAIFCANCDADYSIFGREHAENPKYLKVVTSPTKISKDVIYILKKGDYVKI